MQTLERLLLAMLYWSLDNLRCQSGVQVPAQFAYYSPVKKLSTPLQGQPIGLCACSPLCRWRAPASGHSTAVVNVYQRSLHYPSDDTIKSAFLFLTEAESNKRQYPERLRALLLSAYAEIQKARAKIDANISQLSAGMLPWHPLIRLRGAEGQ